MGPDFAFGTGLSYSQWDVTAWGQDDQELSTEDAPIKEFTVKLTNKGPFPGRQRVLAFARPRFAATHRTMPRQRMWAYAGAELNVGESTVLSFKLEAHMLAHSNELGERVVQPGAYEVAFSDGSTEVPLRTRVVGRTAVVEKSIFRDPQGARAFVI